jgi:hypothetical protein
VTVNGITRWNTTTSAFYALGSGISGGGAGPTVSAMAIGANGNIYIGGSFITAGGVTCNGIAVWNGVSFSPLGSGLGGIAGTDQIRTMIFKNGLLYTAGYFTSIGGLVTPDAIAVWNGSSWVFLDEKQPGASTYYYSITFDMQGNFYIGTSNSGSATTSIVTTVTNHGSAEVHPKVVMTGPGRVYQLENITTGKTIYFDLTLLTGETVTLDLENNTFISTFRGDIRSTILPGSASDFTLQSGDNLISLFIANLAGGTSAVISWTPQYQGVDEAVR